MPATLTFATIRQEQEWDDPRLARILRKIAEEFADFALDQLGWIPCVTSIFRTRLENAAAEAVTEVHCYWRAIDFRTRGIAESDVAAATRWVNERWVYDATRPDLPVAYSAPHGDGPHLHLQVHAGTVPRTPSMEMV